MTIKYLKILIVLLWLGKAEVYAQQQPIYTQYMFSMLSINPAYAGSREVLGVTALFRKQWVGIPGAPQTTILGVDLPANSNWLGLGLQLFNDQIGVEKTSGLVSSYAFRMHLFNSEDEFAIGVQAGLSNFKADYTQVDLIHPYDASFAGNTVNVWLPSLGSGLYYHNNNFYAGFSSPNVLTSSLKNKSVVTQSAVSAKQVSTFFLTSGYVITLNQDLELKPSVLLKATSGAPLQADFNANLWIADRLSVGASYRTGDAIAGMLEVNLTSQFKIGYSYEKGINSLGQFNQGTHELMIRFEISNPDEEKQYYFHPRHF
jgi:type IX secretion system PorP/SprF family membrane protein